MKKNKFMKYIVTCFAALIFLVTLSSCGNSDTKYLNGETCGKATVDGTNEFSQMRRVYCERFVYEYNLPQLAEEKEYATYSDVYKQKFLLDANNNLELIKTDDDRYKQAHYIFVYYEGETLNKVESYVNANVTDSAKYLELVKICANGKEDSVDKKHSYFEKINNTKYDNESTKTVTSVASRMTAHSKACVVFKEDLIDPDTGVSIKPLSYKEAIDAKFINIIAYPLSALINLFVVWFGSSGVAQIFAIILVTIILKLLILLVTFKSQAGTQKMQDIQPEILKIQSKYGPTPSQEDRQRMSMEMMEIYRKYGVKPLAPFASLLLTFPVFIAMYRAVMYLGVLRTGSIGGVVLGNNLSSYIIGENAFKFVALIVFILMAASQILSMKLPQILNRKRMSDEAKKQQKQAGMMTNIMMIMILVMGFMMPVTMSIYWIASAIVGCVQSVIMHNINNGNKKGKYKVKKAESEPIKIPQGYKTNK